MRDSLAEDAARWRYAVTHASWIRSENSDIDYMAVWVPKGSDLSCEAMRENAVDAARKKEE